MGRQAGRDGGREDLQLLFKTCLRLTTARKPRMLCDSAECVVFSASQVLKTAENRIGNHMCSSSQM